MKLNLIFMPVIGAFIGWITNLLAIKMLFRPYRPFTIPIINYKVQGVIPKRQADIAYNVGLIVERQLVSMEDILEHTGTEDFSKKITDSISQILKERMMKKIPAFLPLSFKTVVAKVVEDILKKEIPPLVAHMMDKVSCNFRDDIKLSKIVENKINNFNLVELESLALAISSRELKHIEILGAVLGFIIGLFQMFFAYIFG